MVLSEAFFPAWRLHVLLLGALAKRKRLMGDSKLPAGVNVSVTVCHYVSASGQTATGSVVCLLSLLALALYLVHRHDAVLKKHVKLSHYIQFHTWTKVFLA